jgi:hypothetical protein
MFSNIFWKTVLLNALDCLLQIYFLTNLDAGRVPRSSCWIYQELLKALKMARAEENRLGGDHV